MFLHQTNHRFEIQVNFGDNFDKKITKESIELCESSLGASDGSSWVSDQQPFGRSFEGYKAVRVRVWDLNGHSLGGATDVESID